MLLYLTGGLQNPFSFLFAGPVLISAAALPMRMTLMLGALAVVCATVLVLLPFSAAVAGEDPLELPPLYMIGIWLSLLLAIGYISIYAWQIAEESRQLSDALAATELVLTREHYLSQLDGLAAAAAHELGTPLSTICVVARELERAIEPRLTPCEDIRLLREQAQRCRVILGQAHRIPAPGEPFERMKLSALIEEVVAPHRDVGVAIEVVIADGRSCRAGRGAQSGRRSMASATSWKTPWISPASGSRSRPAGPTTRSVLSISDDGSGFPPEIIDRMGEPYVTSRARRDACAAARCRGSASAFSSPKPCWPRRGQNLLRQPSGSRTAARWSGYAGSGPISSARTRRGQSRQPTRHGTQANLRQPPLAENR